MIPLIHPWTEWQEKDSKADNLFASKWKKNTPKKIIKQYKEWEKYYKEKMKMKFN